MRFSPIRGVCATSATLNFRARPPPGETLTCEAGGAADLREGGHQAVSRYDCLRVHRCIVLSDTPTVRATSRCDMPSVTICRASDTISIPYPCRLPFSAPPASAMEWRDSAGTFALAFLCRAGLRRYPHSRQRRRGLTARSKASALTTYGADPHEHETVTPRPAVSGAGLTIVRVPNLPRASAC